MPGVPQACEAPRPCWSGWYSSLTEDWVPPKAPAFSPTGAGLEPTSAGGQGEVPRGTALGARVAGEDGVALQEEAGVAAVADLVAQVEGGALLDAVGQPPRVSTRVTREHCERGRDTGP